MGSINNQHEIGDNINYLKCNLHNCAPDSPKYCRKTKDLDFIPHVPQQVKGSHAAHKLPPVPFPGRITCRQPPGSEV